MVPPPPVDTSVFFSETFDQQSNLSPAFTPVNGGGRVVSADNGGYLELPESPKSEHGVLFGSALAEGIRVGARFRAESSKEGDATFAVGLSGLEGYRLRVNPKRQRLELLRGTVLAYDVEFQSVPGQWTHLRLQVRALPGLKWAIEGKAWDESQIEPEAWTLEWADTAEPELGQAAVWGTPHGGQPVAVDDVRLWRVD